MRFQGLLQLRRFAATAATLRQAAMCTQTRTHTTMRTLASSASPQPELTQVSKSESLKEGEGKREGERQLLRPTVNEREGGRVRALFVSLWWVVSAAAAAAADAATLGPIADDLCNALQMVVGQKMYRYVQLCMWMTTGHTMGSGVSNHWNGTRLLNLWNYNERNKSRWQTVYNIVITQKTWMKLLHLTCFTFMDLNKSLTMSH